MYNKSMLTKIGNTPVYSSESSNNGIIGYTNDEPDFIVDDTIPLYIVFGDHTRTFNLASNSFSVADNVKVLHTRTKISLKTLLFIVSSWQKNIPNLGYSRHWSIAKNVQFKLPKTKNGEIDFDFMESFIAELEQERMQTLQAYLQATGLDNYELTKEEEKAIADYEKLEFAEFPITQVFNIKNTGNILSRDIVLNSGNTPYLGAGSENNSISSYIKNDEKYLDKGNCVFIGGKTFVVTYQESDFFSNDSHNLTLTLKNEAFKNKLTQLFLATCVNKSLGYKYSWGDSVSNKKIQKDLISLPTANNEAIYKVMAPFIRAIQKLVIKDVVHYANKKLAI